MRIDIGLGVATCALMLAGMSCARGTSSGEPPAASAPPSLRVAPSPADAGADTAEMPHIRLRTEGAALDELVERLDRATAAYARDDRADRRFVLPPMAEHATEHYVVIELEGARIKVHTYPVSNPTWEIYFTVDENDEMTDTTLFEEVSAGP